MSPSRVIPAVVTLALVSLTLVSQVRAASLEYEAADLPDTTPGRDLWQYRYSFDPGPGGLTPQNGFAVEFDASLYAALEDQSFREEWDVLVLQPDTGLPAAGVFDALALDYLDGGGWAFAVNFVWLGGAVAPGSQPFSTYELDDSGLVTVLETGTTSGVPAPEPAAEMLWLAAALLAGRTVRARS